MIEPMQVNIMLDISIFILEILGTIAFAISGATVALEKKMDIFGVAVLGMATAVGGGIIRDLILGNTPPAAFQEPVYAITAFAVALVCFCPPVRRHLDTNSIIILIPDSIGLGIFTVIGTIAGLQSSETNLFLSIFVGVTTGVGGGVLRDIFAGNMPYIFIKHFYACASILGAIACAVLWKPFGNLIAMIIGAALTIILRFLAAKYRWKLPK